MEVRLLSCAPKEYKVEEIFRTKVTKIKDRWHVRLILIKTGEVIDEMACDTRLNIGYCCHTMLRWASKLGRKSPMAQAARRRLVARVAGKIWYRKDL